MQTPGFFGTVSRSRRLPRERSGFLRAGKCGSRLTPAMPSPDNVLAITMSSRRHPSSWRSLGRRRSSYEAGHVLMAWSARLRTTCFGCRAAVIGTEAAAGPLLRRNSVFVALKVSNMPLVSHRGVIPSLERNLLRSLDNVHIWGPHEECPRPNPCAASRWSRRQSSVRDSCRLNRPRGEHQGAERRSPAADGRAIQPSLQPAG